MRFLLSLISLTLLLASCRPNRVVSIKLKAPLFGYVYDVLDTAICCCPYISNANQRLWKLDSLGLNGYRRTVTPLIMSNCDLVGRTWKEVDNFFGQPYSNWRGLTGVNTWEVQMTYIIYQPSIGAINNPNFRACVRLYTITIDEKTGVITSIDSNFTEG
jgi:hypothetical protein